MNDETQLLQDKVEADLAFLLECFREVCGEIGEGEVAESIPWRRGVSPQSHALSLERLCQLYSLAFLIVGMVEENAAVQVRRAMETENGPSHERGLWGNTLQRLKSEGFDEEEISACLDRVHVEPVLTAHPTEARRSTVIAKHRALYLLMVKRENPRLTPSEQFRIREQIKELLELLWRTGNVKFEQPEVSSELESVIHYLKNVFPEAMPIIDARLKAAWVNNGLTVPLQGLDLPRLTFGTWVGGDRDGHPLVTAQVTRESLHELRLNALLVIRRHLVSLGESLSLSDRLQAAPDFLSRWIGERAAVLGRPGAEAVDRNDGESWRQAINLMVASLPVAVIRDHIATLDDSSGYYRHPEELARDLAMLSASLQEVKCDRIAEMELFDLRRLLQCIGFHLAVLDIRQNSAFHDLAVSQLLDAAGVEDSDFPAWSEEKRVAFINGELDSRRPFLLPGLEAGKEAEAVKDCYRVLVEHIQSYGGEGVGSLIVSMTRGCSDLLTVYLLAREAGLLESDGAGWRCRLQVVPLFETIDDLQNAPRIMREFFAHPVTRRTLEAAEGRKPLQQVMIGYSDSCKDGGIVASQGALYKAQRELARVGDEFGVDIRFFHGRGGSIGRGAGPTFRFLEALPHGSLRGSFRMTEQGETVAQKYSNLLTATYNLELQVAGVLGMTVRASRERACPPELERITDLLVASSRKKYEELVGSEGFLPFFSQATPIDVMEYLRIGSRPSRRTGRRTLADLRAIPWVFSWNQSRFMLPGWYGAGSALAELRELEPHLFELLRSDIGRFPLLRYLFMNVELSILQADREIMHLYGDLVGDEPLRRRLMALIDREFDQTQRLLSMLFREPLPQRRPLQLKMVTLRREPLAVLHREQVALLREWRGVRDTAHDTRGELQLRSRLIMSINAIAGGIRSTG